MGSYEEGKRKEGSSEVGVGVGGGESNLRVCAICTTPPFYFSASKYST